MEIFMKQATITGRELKSLLPVAVMSDSWNATSSKWPTTDDVPDDATVQLLDLGDGWTRYTVVWGGGDDASELGSVAVYYGHSKNHPNLSLIQCRIVRRQSKAHQPLVVALPDHEWSQRWPGLVIPQEVLDMYASRVAAKLAWLNIVP